MPSNYFVFISLCLVNLCLVYCNDIEDAFINNTVVPDVINKAPLRALEVSYKSGVKANFGNELTPTQVKEQPTISFEADPEAYYTICLTDPDAPSRNKPTNREFHHWLVVNAKGGDVSQGEVLSQYVGSGPPQGTGLHRYVFVVYKQPDRLKFDEKVFDNRTGKGRGKFSITKFAEKYSLGDPVAGNFYQAKYDEYVPKLHKQLGF